MEIILKNDYSKREAKIYVESEPEDVMEELIVPALKAYGYHEESIKAMIAEYYITEIASE